MKLTPRTRARMKPQSFALPKERKYPINDKQHATVALARVKQHGTPEQKRKVRLAVHRKYPNLQIKGLK
jgi:hypothetical protein